MDSEFATGAKSANEQAADAAKDLPLEERLVHTQWKVRQLAYTDFAKALPLLEAHEFGKFADMLPRMASDSNAAALDSGVSALCTFFKEVPLSSMQYLNDERNAVVSSAVEKGLVSTKPGTRTNSLELILTVAEADSPQPVVETIMNGLWTHKTPKVVTAAVSAVRECVHAFGSKTMKLKPIVEQMPKLFGHTDKNVRAEAQKLAIEMYRWLGDPLLTLLEDGGQLKPVQVTELKDACNTLNKDEPVKQARLLRSQVLKEREMQEQATSDDSGTGNNNNDNDAGEADEGNAGEDLFDPVKVLHLLPEEFNSEATSTKWAERKKAMTDLAEVLKPPKLDTGDNYSEIVELLSKRIADVNINVCIAAAECVTKLANGLRSAFNNYRSVITPPIIERLKERKATVIDALKSALDAISQSAGDGAISDMIESVTSSRSHKNPQVRSEMQRWLSRTLSKVKLIPTKGESKQIIEMTMGVLDDSDADVREAGYEVIGTLMKCVGEPLVKAVLPSEFDNKKMEKIIDYCSKATVVAKPPKAAAPPPRQPAPKPSMPSGNDDGMAPPKRSIPPALARRLGAKVDTDDSGNSDSSPPAPKPPALKPAAKPPLPKPAATAAAASKKPVATSAATASAAKKPAPGGGKSSEEPVKFIYEDDTFASAVGEFISGEILEGLSSSQWKQRKEACEKLSEELKTNTSQVPEMELIVRQFSVKPGWKDSNVQVLGLMYGIMEYMASRDESVSLPTGAAALSIPPLAEKLGDAKLKTSSGSCLTAYCKHSSVQFVLSHSFPALAGIKAPKALADSIGWISATLLEFGVQGVKLRDIVDFVKSTGLSNSNAAVRTASIGLLGTLARFAGDVIRPLVEDISPQTMALVDAEFARVKDLPAPEVTQSCLWNSASGSSSGGGGGGGSGGNDVLDELFPRVNISSQLTSKLMQEMADSNWKQRKEALDTVTNIIAATNNRIEPPIGNLAESLKLRLSDVNKNLVLQTMGLVGVLATAMGKPFEKSAARVLTQPIMSCINDQKANMRAAAISALDQIYVACESSVEFAVNPAVTALNTDSSVLRKDLLTWLCAKTGATDDPQTSGVDTSSNLPDLSSWTSPLLACCQDRTVDARKLAQQLLGPVIRTCSFEHVWRAVNDLKGVSKNSVAPMVEVYKHLASSGTIAASSSPEVAPAGVAGRTLNRAGTTAARRPTSMMIGGGSRSSLPGTGSTDDSASSGSVGNAVTAATLLGKNRATAAGQASTASATATLPRRLGQSAGAAVGSSSSAPGIRPQSMAITSSRTSMRPSSAYGMPPPLPQQQQQQQPIRSQPAAYTPSPAPMAPIDDEAQQHQQHYAVSPAPIVDDDVTADTADYSATLPPILSADIRAKQARISAAERSGMRQSATSDELFAIMRPHFNPAILQLMFSTARSAAQRDRDSLWAQSVLDDCIKLSTYSEESFGVSLDEMNRRFVANSDLLIQYLIMPPIGNNPAPTVLSRSLDFAERLVILLDDSGSQLSNFEANLFVSYLIKCTGDSRDWIRKKCNSILSSRISRIYPASKVFSIVLREGLLSSSSSSSISVSVANVSKMRSSCLELISTLFSRGGTTVVTGSDMTAEQSFSIVAQHVADADDTVHSAALNAMQHIYEVVGNQLFGMLNGGVPGNVVDMIVSHLQQAPPSNQQQSSQQPQQQPVPSQLNGGPGTARASASSQLQQRSRLAAPGASSLQRPMSTAASQRQSALPPASGMQQPSAGGAVRQLRPPGGGGVSGLQAPSSPHRGQPQQLQRPQATANAATSLQTVHQQQQQQQQQPIEEGIPSHRLDVVISQIVNSDPYSSIEALRYLEPFLTNSEEYSDESAVISSLANCIDEIVGALTIAMRTAFTSDDKEIVGSQTHSRLCKSIVNCLLHVFNRRPLGAAVTQNTLHMTLSELLNRLLDPSISRLAIGPQLAKSVNLLVMRVLNGAERTAIFCVLVSLLEQSCSAVLLDDSSDLNPQLANEQNKFTDLVQKCLWKITKTLRDDVRNDNIRINEVLLQVHKFMVTLPQSLWRELAKSDSTSGGGGGGEQTMQRDMPFRTVKTILHEIAITHGDAAWGYLDLIDNRHTSYVYTYLAALLDPSRSMIAETERNIQQRHQPPPPPLPTHIPQQVHQAQHRQYDSPQQQYASGGSSPRDYRMSVSDNSSSNDTSPENAFQSVQHQPQQRTVSTSSTSSGAYGEDPSRRIIQRNEASRISRTAHAEAAQWEAQLQSDHGNDTVRRYPQHQQQQHQQHQQQQQQATSSTYTGGYQTPPPPPSLATMAAAVAGAESSPILERRPDAPSMGSVSAGTGMASVPAEVAYMAQTQQASDTKVEDLRARLLRMRAGFANRNASSSSNPQNN